MFARGKWTIRLPEVAIIEEKYEGVWIADSENTKYKKMIKRLLSGLVHFFLQSLMRYIIVNKKKSKGIIIMKKK